MYYMFSTEPPEGVEFRHITALDHVYCRGWPVLMAVWVSCRFDYDRTHTTARYILDSFSDWDKIRHQQDQAGVLRMNKEGFLGLINRAREKPGWRDMPKHMFMCCLADAVAGCREPVQSLSKFVAGRREAA